MTTAVLDESFLRTVDLPVCDRFEAWTERLGRTHAPTHLASDRAADHHGDQRILGLGDVTVWPATTGALAAAIGACEKPPAVFVSGSAVGYHGETGTDEVDESAGAGHDFLAGVCRDWEAAAKGARTAGTRVANPRFGVVVTAQGGAMGRLLPLARAGLGGRLGSGRQYWGFISLPDTVRAPRHLVDTDSVGGPVNLTSPHPETNRDITATVGKTLHRPTLPTVPDSAIRLALGEFTDGILMSQRVLPTRLLESGFTFEHPTFEAALGEALG
ncbi:TIGR01777 family oxidoreductase [Streptomyces sp. NPDC048419]|uniref:TIGR01777 family oxidoreductase n=1 Tax=Streptomyces sp. NPDC048419 TaxID=3365547 RepID=UPI003719277D